MPKSRHRLTLVERLLRAFKRTPSEMPPDSVWKYIGRMKPLNAGMYRGPKIFYTGRTSIPPVKPKNPTKIHPITGKKGEKYIKMDAGLDGNKYIRGAA